MITLIEIKKAITDKLRANFPGVDIPTPETKQGFKRPCFFVQLIPFNNIRDNKVHRTKSVNVDVTYYSANNDDLENMAMVDNLENVLDLTLNVGDRRLMIDNTEISVVDEALHFQFTLTFTDSKYGIVVDLDTGEQQTVIPDEEFGYTDGTVEPMRELELKEGF